MAIGITTGLIAAGKGIKRMFRKKGADGEMENTGLTNMLKGAGRT